MRNRHTSLGGEDVTPYSQTRLRKQPTTGAPSLPHSGYVLRWEDRESRGKEKGSNFG